MDVLYPHFQRPVPSMAIAQFALDRGQGELMTGHEIARGSALESDSPDGRPCRFRTCLSTTLWPIEVVSAKLMGRPFTAPAANGEKVEAVLRLELKCFAKGATFAQLTARSLQFYLKGQSQHVFPLYELLFNHTRAVALAESPRDPRPVWLGPECIRPVGFERDQGMLPYGNRSFPGYRLLTEYFAFPQKFLFFELAGLEKANKASGTLEIYFYLDRSSVDLEQNVGADTFRLGCTPIVNLYAQRAEPIPLTHGETEYRVVPDAQSAVASEIYSIERVTATSPDHEVVEYQPFYSFRHAVEAGKQKAFWHATRRAPHGGGGEDRSAEVYLSLLDLGFTPSAPARWTLDVETTCFDRDRPHRLPFGEGQPVLRLGRGAPVGRIECLSRPTAALRPALKHAALWRVISHLSLNHLSLVDTDDGAHALREILKLYDLADSAETQAMIEGLLSVESRRVVGRWIGEPRSGFCRGLEVRLHFDENRFAGSGVFLFACVLERFLGLYCTLNSFSRLVVTTNKREGELRRWPPRAGERVLL